MATDADAVLLPHNQSFRRIQLDHTTILLSVSEDGVSLGKESNQGDDINNSPKGYYVFAENIQLNNSFKILLDSPASLATISTHSLRLSSGKESQISVSGQDGMPNDTGGKREDTIDGKSSGSLCVYIQNCSTDLANLLNLSANGGKGGDSKERKGTAGHGGKGGNVQWVGLSVFTDLSTFLLRFAENKLLNESLPENEVLTPSHSITLYLQRALVIAAQIPRPTFPGTKSIADIVKPIQSVVNSQSKTVGDARDAVWDVRQAIDAQHDADDDAIHNRISILGGEGGSVEPRKDADERGSAGTPGQRGTRNVTLLSEVEPHKLHTQNTVFVHPDQCQMLYDRAMTFWYFGRPATAIELLSRLFIRLSFVSEIKDDDALYKAYAAQEKTLGTSDSIEKLKALRQTVSNQLCILESGRVDFYGYTKDWVPRVSYAEYNNRINSAMQVLTALETSYIKYHDGLEKQKSVSSVIKETKADIKRSTKEIEKERSTLNQMLETIGEQIKLGGPPIMEKHKKFQKAFEDLKDKIKKAHKFTPDQIFNALSTMAGSGSWAEAAKSGALLGLELGYSLEHTYPDDTDARVNKTVIIKNLRRSIATSLGDFDADFEKDDISGEFTVDGRVPRFLMEQVQLDEILAEYSTAAFAGAGAELQRLFKDFTDALQAHNSRIVTYNAVIQTICKNAETVKQLDDMYRKADNNIILDEDLPQLTEYFRTLFEDARARVMRYLSMGQRALKFKIFREEDLLERSDGRASGDIPLSVTSDVLSVIRSNLEDLLLNANEEDSGDPSRFPADWENGHGKRRTLSDEELVTLRSEKKVQIMFAPVVPGQKSENSDFANSTNVRVYRVRFIIEGLKANPEVSKAPHVRCIIQHGGNETIVSRRLELFRFEHAALNAQHEYSIDEEGEVVSISNDGTWVNYKPDGEDGIFGVPGPYTVWDIDATASDWDAFVDGGNGITGAYLEFFGTSYAPLPKF